MNIWATQPGLIEQLIAAVAEGLSFSLVARRLGHGLTRNACIGKARRMGLVCINEGGSRKGRDSREPRMPNAKMPTLRRTPLPIPTTPMPDALRVPMLDLQYGHCRWPLWSHTGSGEPDFPHCGLPKSTGSWCSHHAVTVFGPAKKAVAA